MTVLRDKAHIVAALGIFARGQHLAASGKGGFTTVDGKNTGRQRMAGVSKGRREHVNRGIFSIPTSFGAEIVALAGFGLVVVPLLITLFAYARGQKARSRTLIGWVSRRRGKHAPATHVKH